MMTSVAFIAALIPLLIAKGPGEASMYAVALPVFGGMLLASLVGIFFIPVTYVAIQRVREHVRPSLAKPGGHETPPLVPGE